MQINQESNEPQDVPIGVNTRPAERVSVTEQAQSQERVAEPSHAKRTISTRLGSLVVLLVAVIAGGGFWMMGVSYEAPETVADVDQVVKEIQEQRELNSIPTFVLAEEIEASFLDMQWVATSSMYGEETSSKAIFYNDEIVAIEGVSYIPASEGENEGSIISALEERGYAWSIDIEKYDVSLSGAAADGPNGSMHGMLKYDSETDALHTIVVSSKRYLNDVCVENEVEWFSDELGKDGCEIESEFEVFVSEVVDAGVLLGFEEEVAELPDGYEIKDGKVYNEEFLNSADIRRLIGGRVDISSSSIALLYEEMCFWGEARNPYPPEADAPSDHEYLGDCYTTYKNEVYYNDKLVEGADVNTFTLLEGNEVYGKDEASLYYKGGKIDFVDPLSYRILDEYYSKDATHVYYRQYDVHAAVGYDFSILKVIENADPANFVVIENRYSKDNTSVYYRYERVHNADPTTFKIVDGARYHGKDDYRVYKGAEIIEGADPATFESVKYGGDYYLKDKKNVYFQGYPETIIKGADPATFELLGRKNVWMGVYARDKRVVYYKDREIEGVDPVSFIVLPNDDYAKDNTNVYYEGGLIPNADAATFETDQTEQSGYVGGGASDNNNIYDRGKIVD